MDRKIPQAGFTLLEIGLALSIALLASAAVVVLYAQVKDNAGDASMRAKIGSLQSVVENLYSAQGACPDLNDVRMSWAAKRQDALESPWGGNVADLSTYPPSWPAGLQRAGITGGDITANDVRGAAEGSMGVGGLYYYRVVTAAAPVVPTAIATASLYDVTLGRQVDVTGYGLAGIKHQGWRHFMVTSGR